MVEKEIMEGNYSNLLKRLVSTSRSLNPSEEKVLADIMSSRRLSTAQTLQRVMLDFPDLKMNANLLEG